MASQIDRIVLVGGASRTPMVHRLLSEQLGQPIHAEVDPDLCVSMGAALQGGLIAGLDLGAVLVDITPHTLGVQCVGEMHGFESEYLFSPLINRNTALPAIRSEVFSTMFDSQNGILVSVFQGENEDVRHNDLVGEFPLDGLADVKAGNEILIRFELDLDGILKVTASEKATGLAKALTIENAISRFRDTERDGAQARIEAAFQSDDSPGERLASNQVPVAERGQDLSAEVEQAIEKAQALLIKSEQLVADADPSDAEEMSRLAKQLRAAIDAESLDQLEQGTTALDDLVFYMQDA